MIENNEILMRSTIVETASGPGVTIQRKKISAVINQLKTDIYAGLVNRFEYVNSKSNLLAATLLDPRYKEIPFEEYKDSISLKQAKHYAE